MIGARVLISSFAGTALLAAAPVRADTKLEIVRDLVETYQAESYARYGVGIALDFPNADSFQATGGMVATGRPEIRFYRGIFRLEPAALVYVACHELGHILGRVPLALTSRAGAAANLELDSVEGEADYFAGRCAARYFGDPRAAVTAARDALSEIYRERVELWDPRFLDAADGIDPSYPDRACRLLSVAEGAYERPRPRCWFNP